MSKKQQSKFSVTKSFSFPPEVAEFIEKRAVEVGMKPSNYITELVQRDESHNTMADIHRAEAERLAGAAA